MSGSLTVITYAGRRSGRTFSTPVGYRRTAGGVRILVRCPIRSSGGATFQCDGGEVTVLLDKQQRAGHAAAERSGRRVYVSVSFG